MFKKTIVAACAIACTFAASAQESFVVGIRKATVEDGIVAFKTNELKPELWYDVNDPVLKAWRNSGQPMPGTMKLIKDENPNKCWRLTHENMDAVGVNTATGESQKGTLSAIERVNCKERSPFPIAEVIGKYVGYIELVHMVDANTLKKWLTPSAEADAQDEKYFELTAALKRGEISEDYYYHDSGLKRVDMGRVVNYPSKGIKPVEVYIPRKLYRDAYSVYGKLYGFRNENDTRCYAIGYNTPIVVKEEFPYVEFPYIESFTPVDEKLCYQTSAERRLNVNLPNETH
jgi:hypothetical protein